MTKPFWITFNKKRQCAGPVTAKCYHLECIHLHPGPVWTGVWWDTWCMSITNTQLFTLLPLALNVKRYKYLKKCEWESEKVGDKETKRELSPSSCVRTVCITSCVFFLECILRYFSCCECVWLCQTYTSDGSPLQIKFKVTCLSQGVAVALRAKKEKNLCIDNLRACFSLLAMQLF